MKAYLFVATLIGLISCSLAFEYGYCQFTATEYDPSITGYAYFITSDKPGYINMYVNVQGITVNPGIKHGIHVHQFGDISDVATGQSVGSHWDPTNNPHGCPPEDNRHFGDTGNWFVEEDGTINDFKTLDLLELGGGDSIIGRAVVIHNQTDDCVTVASSSTRLAFCVIGVGNPTLYNASQTTNSASNDHPSTPVAVCDLQPIANSGVTGRVWFQQDAKTGEVTVTALVNGISGEHGFHIHQWGDLSQPNNGSSVGGHYNPLNVAHAIPPETVRHIGDMGNIYYSINSTTMAYQYIFDDGSITLSGQNNVIGRGIVVHQNVDDCSQPTGNAGNRYAFCVIGIAADSTVPTGVPEGVPTTQNDSACPSSAYVVRIA